MISRAIFWELECASWKDGDHQWYAALAALTLPGAGEGTDNPQGPTANAVRGFKTREAGGRVFPPREPVERAARGHGRRR